MLLGLSDDQTFLRETTGRYLADKADPAAIRRLADDPTGYSEGYWRQGAELGWTSLLVAEADGGGSVSGRGLIDACLIAHEFGAAAAPGPLQPTAVAAQALSVSGGHPDLLTGLLDGSSVVTLAMDEPPPGDRIGTISTSIEIDGDELVVHGAKRPVESAGSATHLLVTGTTGEDLSQVLVPSDAAGVSIEPLQSVDLTRRFASVRFDRVRVPAAAVVGELGAASEAVERQRQLSIVLGCAESVGAMQRAFDITVEWGFDRYSFGRPLVSYQALKHRYAEMAMWLEGSYAIAADAADAVCDASPDAATLASAAKAYVGSVGSELLHDCVQLHGGIGVTYEHDLHLYLRRHTANRVLHGSPSEHQRRIAAALVEAS